VPVESPRTIEALGAAVDGVVGVEVPKGLRAVGRFYGRFDRGPDQGRWRPSRDLTDPDRRGVSDTLLAVVGVPTGMQEYEADCTVCDWRERYPRRGMAEHAKRVHENRSGHSVVLDRG